VPEERVVLVTGCSTGIGRSLVPEFARRGFRVLATTRTSSEIADLASSHVCTARLDVCSPADRRAAVQAALDRWGRLDLLVNNAGSAVAGPLAELSLDELRAQFETNVLAPLAMVQEALPCMLRARRGVIANMSSINAVVAIPFNGAYVASKAALSKMSEVLRLELLPFGIRVVDVQPGSVESAILDKVIARHDGAALEASLYGSVLAPLLKRLAESPRLAMPAPRFSRHLVEQLARRCSPRRVRLGRHSRIGPAAARWMPGALLDRILMREVGLPARLPPRRSPAKG